MGQARLYRLLSKRFVLLGIVFSILICISAGLVLWRAIGRDANPEQMQLADVHWGYAGDTGPARWGDLSPTFEECKQGVEQSPIDLTGDAEARPHVLEFRYLPSPLEIVNNGHTIQVNYAPGSMLIVGDREYALLQFHFHRLSEHTVNREPADMELHLVHSDDAGNLAVVGVFLQAGQPNLALEQVWNNTPAQESETRLVPEARFNAADLLPLDLSYYAYAGSLTTPPCTEGVRWFVLSAPLEVSPEQLHEFAALFSENARPTQPLNDRTILFSHQDNEAIRATN